MTKIIDALSPTHCCIPMSTFKSNNEDSVEALPELRKVCKQIRSNDDNNTPLAKKLKIEMTATTTTTTTTTNKKQKSLSTIMYDRALQLAVAHKHDLTKEYIILQNCTPNSEKRVTVIAYRKVDVSPTIHCIKEMCDSYNFGIDQLGVFDAKRNNILKLKGLHVPGSKLGVLVSSKTKFVQDENSDCGIATKDTTDRPAIYFITEALGDGSSDLRYTHQEKKTTSKLLSSKEAIQSLASIIIFRTILGVKDTKFSNVLVHDGKLYSVDENGVGQLSFRDAWTRSTVVCMSKEAYVAGKKIGHQNLKDFLPEWLDNPEERNIIRNNLDIWTNRYNLPSVVGNFDQFCYEMAAGG